MRTEKIYENNQTTALVNTGLKRQLLVNGSILLGFSHQKLFQARLAKLSKGLFNIPVTTLIL